MSIPPLLFALLMWFIGTATVVWLDSRPRETFRTSLTLAGVVGGIKRIGLIAAAATSFAWLYCTPVKRNTAPAAIRLVPAW